jgi:hypothetical protein
MKDDVYEEGYRLSSLLASSPGLFAAATRAKRLEILAIRRNLGFQKAAISIQRTVSHSVEYREEFRKVSGFDNVKSKNFPEPFIGGPKRR